MEYASLRQEFLQRMDTRHKIIDLTLTFAAAFLGVALSKSVSPSIALGFPPIGTLLAMDWVYHDYRQIQTLRYLREKLETRIPDLCLGWEAYKKDKKGFSYVARSHSGVFLFTEFLAIFIGIFDPTSPNLQSIFCLPVSLKILLAIDFACFLFTLKLFWRRIWGIKPTYPDS